MTEESKYAVEIGGLTRYYGKGESEVRALDGVDLKIAHGELVAIMGPSGSGKSTLLNMIGALDQPTAGSVIVDGRDVAKIRNKDRFRGKTIGFVFQLHNLIPTLTARENVEVPMMGYNPNPLSRRTKSRELLEKVGLGDRLRHLPGQLSGGQRQRVAVARALANDPSIILADEPTGSLDSTAGTALMDLLNELNAKDGTTIIIVTHDPAVARRTRRVVVMADGRISRTDTIGSPLEEDLKMWQHSELGQRISHGDVDGVSELLGSPDAVKMLQDLLQNGTNGAG